ncbi:MAG: hypothetical protein DIU78_023305 [Pseudomonadota bacterium]
MTSTAPPTPRTTRLRRADGWHGTGLQATHLRLALIQVSLAAPATADGAPHHALELIRERAVQLIRRLDSGSPDDLLHGVCFAARIGLSEARRELLADAAGHGTPDLVRARLALYHSLLLIAQVVAANAPDHGADTTVALDTLQTFLRAAEPASVDDAAWFLDVADGELTLFSLSAHLAGSSHQRHVAAFRSAIAAWKRHGRDPQIAHQLRDSILGFAHPWRARAATSPRLEERPFHSARPTERKAPALYD